MKSETTGDESQSDSQNGTAALWLERLTGVILLLVLAALGWMVAVATWPGSARLPGVEYEVALMLTLLGLGLGLVSLVALIHTRR
jgi:succinate dehydrogenase hydrophobic anchor subunit